MDQTSLLADFTRRLARTAPEDSQVGEAIVTARSVLEVAKGVLAQLHGVGPASAYELLLDRARREGIELTDTARRVVREQHS